MTRGFASDNWAGAHPDVLAAVAAANSDHAPAYGADRWMAAARERIREHLGETAEPYLVFNGTAANVLSIGAVAKPHEAVICAESAHLNVDECGAPERIAGVKLLTVATEHGKLTPADLVRWEDRRGDEHHVQPRVVSISQATELGTVFKVDEVQALAAAAHGARMLLHVDGARLANAAASLGVSLRELTTDAGVDVLSFGATKNGALGAEAVVFLAEGLGEGFEFARKQGMQLGSKMRFAAAQVEALLGDDLWLRNAEHANAMARRLADGVAGVDGVAIAHPVEANAVFASLPRPTIERVQAEHFFYVWDEASDVVRWMCSWDTQPEDVDALIASVSAAA